MQGHQQKGRQTNTSSNNKDKSNTIIETRTAEGHDDENLHHPSTRPHYSPGSRRRAVGDHTIVVDSHIQRIVLATEETTVTQQVSHRPTKCQSRLWSQRGTKVNGSHHGDNPLLRPTVIRIATKSYEALQEMAQTNIKTVHQTYLLQNIESNLDRLGMLSPTHDQRSQQKNGKITLQPVLINKSKILKATHCTEKRKNEIPRSMVVEALSW